MPLWDEKRAIVEVLTVIDRNIDPHWRKHAVLEELFKVLPHNLMNGEVRVGEFDLSMLLGDSACTEETF